MTEITAEMAERIIVLNAHASKIDDEKFAIQKELGVFTWSDVQSKLIEFLGGQRNANAR